MNSYNYFPQAMRWQTRVLLLISSPILLTAQLPFGHLDCPGNDPSCYPRFNLSGAINVTGWAISPYSVSKVSIFRDPFLPGEGPGLVLVQDAPLLAGARPDLPQSYPGYPNNDWGWGTQVLSNELPDNGPQDGGYGYGGYTLHAIACDPVNNCQEIGAI